MLNWQHKKRATHCSGGQDIFYVIYGIIAVNIWLQELCLFINVSTTSHMQHKMLMILRNKFVWNEDWHALFKNTLLHIHGQLPVKGRLPNIGRQMSNTYYTLLECLQYNFHP